MSGLRHKASVKCECGKTVAEGSVFCPHCRAEINRKNARTIKNRDSNDRKEMRGKGRSRKK